MSLNCNFFIFVGLQKPDEDGCSFRDYACFNSPDENNAIVAAEKMAEKRDENGALKYTEVRIYPMEDPEEIYSCGDPWETIYSQKGENQ